MSSLPKQIGSPFSSGGGGDDLQSHVGAYYLTSLLLRQTPRGQDAGVLRRVRFQRLYEGEALDDLIGDVDGPNGPMKLALQIKNDVTISELSELFDEVLEGCWRTFASGQFSKGKDRFGVVLGVSQTKINRHYQTVLAWARTSASAASFFTRIGTPKLAANEMRDFVDLFRKKLTKYQGSAVGDHDLWEFLTSFVILEVDLLHEASRDRSHAVDGLQHLIQPGPGPGASHLFNELVVLSSRGNRTAGEYTLESLSKELQARGFRLAPSRDCREDLGRLEEFAGHVLGDIRTDIGGLVLDRAAALEASSLGPRDAGLLLLTGPPGVGKSGLWKALVEEHRLHGPSLVLAADRMEGIGWTGFASALGIRAGLPEILLGISTHPSPCIFIDGLDKIEGDGPRAVVNDVLRTAAKTLTTSSGAARWWCAATARENDPDRLRWLDRNVFRQVTPVRVPELSEVDLELVAQVHSHLRPLLAEKRLEAILRNPLFLDILTDARLFGGGGAPPPGTEVEVSDVWWDRIVGQGGRAGGKERQQTLASSARSLLTRVPRRFPDQGLPAAALASLESDRLILRDRGRSVYRFAHDLHEDWALLRVLDQEVGDLPRFLTALGEPVGLFRAVQLLGCSLLEKEPTAGPWAALLRAIESDGALSPRWRQAALTGLLLPTRTEELLDRAADVLFEGNSQRLVDLLTALRTSEIDLDPRMMTIAESLAKTPGEAFALAIRFPLPRWRVWCAVLRWLVRHAGRLDGPARDEATKLMVIWQERTPADAPLRREIAELVLRWLEEFEGAEP